MAPHGDKSDAADETMVAKAEKRPISTILIVMVMIFASNLTAMQSEALPVVNKLNLSEDLQSVFPKGVPWVRYRGFYKDLNINLVCPGKDSSLGVDCVGTVPASLVTYASIQALQPDLIINAGTAGGFKAKGACIGDVYVASDVAFCDRRIPIPVFDLYGLGLRQALSTPNLQKELNLKDEASMVANDAVVKDMEAAAVAYVADLLKVPSVFLKVVIDIKDGEETTAEESSQSFAALERAVTQVTDFINGKCLSDL
ncbi:PREDICTED: 5'-methylthioadenosine/S-adenosylhomocysteine [Prunus dulcis]|uniref:PREDICTED: 5'-methylthioadenosine/S-adenosylhomocysteine n=1 Tax=Prunus dulcis TaxID=3755 RepID=A0A5E4EJL7_PRUDU|nr:PREDICTED: 5'-methylthioadenosine/S-adenosylhomocysteine [Prunus dulcis]